MRIPTHFTFILRALMTLEGVGMTIDPHFKLFEVARPYTLRYTIRRESRYWGGLLLTRLLAGEAGSIDREGLGKLAKLAVTYVRSRTPLLRSLPRLPPDQSCHGDLPPACMHYWRSALS